MLGTQDAECNECCCNVGLCLQVHYVAFDLFTAKWQVRFLSLILCSELEQPN